jgi:hypothetical protein
MEMSYLLIGDDRRFELIERVRWISWFVQLLFLLTEMEMAASLARMISQTTKSSQRSLR